VRVASLTKGPQYRTNRSKSPRRGR
jgi:hypothetical protein